MKPGGTELPSHRDGLQARSEAPGADPRIPCFWGGIGDVFLQCCTNDRYRILGNADPPAIVVNASWNEYLGEYFRWHPNAERFRVIHAPPPAGMKITDPRFFESLGLPPTSLYLGKRKVDWDTEFFPSPEDMQRLARLDKSRYGLFAPFSKERKTLPEPMVRKVLARLQEWRGATGFELFGVGRNYRFLNREAQSFEELARQGWLTDLSPYGLSVPAAIELAREAEFYVGADSCLALVTMSRGRPTVIIEPDDHANCTRRPQLFDLANCLLLQKFSAFDAEAVLAFLRERL